VTIVNLPDFDRVYELAQSIKDRSIELAKLDLELDIKRADINKLATNNSEYLINGKPPSQDYLKNTLLITGINGELIPIREQINLLSSELDYLKRSYEIIKMIVEIWRTESANERSAL